ncbi:MAG: type II toxin-antitoxin system toxin ribonuclease C26 [Sporichthyaceae bacterium]
MTLIVDAGALYAQANLADPDHRGVVAVLDAEPGPLMTCEAAAQEADYLIGDRLGVDVELAFLRDLAEGTFEVACLDLSERRAVAELAARYRDLRLGLADATLMVLAARLRTVRVLTLNTRHFRAVRPLYGEAFVVLPADLDVER